MRTDYKTAKRKNFKEVKAYLIQVCHHQDIQNKIYECMKSTDLKKVLDDHDIYETLFLYALNALYKTIDYEELEYHIIMMNILFERCEYFDIKRQLFDKLMKRNIGVDEYCVLRHLIPFEQYSFFDIIQILDEQYHVDTLECAKICLLEDQSDLAYHYLRTLDYCDDENVLDLLLSYSIRDYLSLEKHYRQKRGAFLLAAIH